MPSNPGHPPLPTARVGRTSLTVTRLGFGAAPIANLFITVPEEVAHATVHTALEAGIRFFDTAPLYGRGLSERRLGEGLAGFDRNALVIQTKVGRTLTAGEAAIGKEWGGHTPFDYSRDAILRGLETSLQRLKISAIDIALIHDPDNHMRQALDEAFPTLADLRAQGVIKAIGAGMNQWQAEREFALHADPDCFLLAGRYTLLEQESLEFLDLCASRSISVFLGGVFNSGILARGPQAGAPYNYEAAPPEILDRVGRIQAVCDRHQVDLKSAALHFAAAHPAVTALIVGMTTPSEVRDNLQAWQSPVPTALWADLKSEGLIRPESIQ
jgi:D-threo-aldose 1-dehydrogenase